MTSLAVAHEVLKYFSDEKTHRSGAVDWALIYDNQEFKNIQLYEGEPCLGMLPSQPPGAKYFVVWFFSRLKYAVRTDESKIRSLKNYERKYISYIIKDSIFADCFHTKNVNHIFNKGAIMKTNKPAQFIYSAATCIRYIREYPDIAFFWSKFRDYIGDDAALVLAHLFTYKDEITYKSDSFWSSPHKWMVGPSSFGKDEFKVFLNRDFSIMNKLPNLSENCNFRGVTRIWNGLGSSNSYDACFQIPQKKRLKWTGGIERVNKNNWSRYKYREYKFSELKKDLKAMMEINCVQ